MQNTTRLQFNAYLEQIATLNNVSNAAQKFNVVTRPNDPNLHPAHKPASRCGRGR